MNNQHKKFDRGQRCILALAVMLQLICAAWVTAQDSPEAVFQAAQTAGAQRDMTALVKLVAPSEHAMMAFATDMAVGMFVEFYEGQKAEDIKKAYQTVQEKYGVKEDGDDEGEKLNITSETPQEVIDAHIRKRAENKYGGVDAVAYIPELMAIILAMPEMAEQEVFPQQPLTGLTIEGDKAAGMSGDKKVTFIREDGRWYLSADVMN